MSYCCTRKEAITVMLKRAVTVLEQAERTMGQYGPWEETSEAKQLVKDAVEELEY